MWAVRCAVDAVRSETSATIHIAHQTLTSPCEVRVPAGRLASQVFSMIRRGNHRFTTGTNQPQPVQARPISCPNGSNTSALIRTRWNQTR